MEQNSLQQVSRRNFMKGALVAGAATAAMGLAACSPSSRVSLSLDCTCFTPMHRHGPP